MFHPQFYKLVHLPFHILPRRIDLEKNKIFRLIKMQSSLTTQRGTESVENMFGLIIYEARNLGLSFEQKDTALFVFPKQSFPDVFGIKPTEVTAVALYTKIEVEDGGEVEGGRRGGPLVVDLGFLELLAMVPTFKKDVYPFARCSTYLYIIGAVCLSRKMITSSWESPVTT